MTDPIKTGGVAVSSKKPVLLDDVILIDIRGGAVETVWSSKIDSEDNPRVIVRDYDDRSADGSPCVKEVPLYPGNKYVTEELMEAECFCDRCEDVFTPSALKWTDDEHKYCRPCISLLEEEAEIVAEEESHRIDDLVNEPAGIES